MRRCDYCKEAAPVHEVHYRQNTGMVFMRQSRQWEGNACRDCSHDLFLRATMHTLVLGWWGTISFFVTPIYLFLNVACWLKSRSLPRRAAVRRDLLEERRQYALNLLDCNGEAAVVDVLVKDTGLPRGQVEAWVAALRRTA